MSSARRVGRPLSVALTLVVILLGGVSAVAPVAGAAPPGGPGGPGGAGGDGNGGSPPPSTSSTTTAPAPLSAATATNALTVASQTSWVGNTPNAAFKISLRLGRAASAASQLQVNVYAQVRSRTLFDSSLSGRYHGEIRYSQSQSIGALPRNNGAVSLALPVNSSSSTAGTSAAPGPGTLPPVQMSSDADGVFPVQIAAVDSDGKTVGQPVITYLVWVPMTTGSPKLDVSLMLPVHAAPPLTKAGDPAPLPAATASALQAEANQLNRHPGVPLSLAATPQTLNALAGGSKPEQATLASLASAIGPSGDETLPEPYVRLDLPGMSAAGLGGEITPQIDAGTSTLSAMLHSPVATTTWALSGPVDAATVADLRSRGATQLIVPDESLSPLPTALQENTLAHPTRLAGSPVEVLGADPELPAHFTDGGDQVLQANQFLAELAMIETEQPSIQRGVAVIPPSNWQPTSAFLDNVLSGLQGNPLVAPVTAQKLFADVPAATTSSAAPVTRSLVGSSAPAMSATDAAAVRSLRAHITALGQTLPGVSGEVGRLDQRLLVSESADLDGPGRAAALESIQRELGNGLAGIQIPQNVSVTLTSNSGTVPITVQSSVANARVRLMMVSQKLTFRPFTPPGGSCQVTSSTTESCLLTLSGPSTLLRLPVEARATGVFGLNLTLYTSDGTVLIGQARYTVRNTSISGVALGLTIGAAVLLGAWWIRDRRHGRRARQLVPAPPGQAPDADADDVASTPQPGNGSAREDLDDPEVAEFFASAPPDYADPAPATTTEHRSAGGRAEPRP